MPSSLLRLIGVGTFLAIAACGQSGPQGQKPTPPISATPSQTPSPAGATSPQTGPRSTAGLFGVLAGGIFNDGPGLHSRVQIMDIDGKVVATADFTPRTLPIVGASPLLQDEARVAAGKVYYADGAGVIRTLAPDGTISVVVTIPFKGGQQEMSFAVSPDGKVLEAAVVTFPPPASNPRETPADPFWDPGNLSVDLYRVLPPQRPSNILHQDWTQDSAKPWPTYQAVGYDSEALFTMPTVLGTQQPYNGSRWFGPAVHYTTLGGLPSAALGGSGCDAKAANGAGMYVCMDQRLTNPALRKADGSLVWAFPNAGENYSYFAFAPSGNRLAYFKFSQSTPARTEVITTSGELIAHLNTDFRPRAWLNEETLLGESVPFQGTRQIAYVVISSPDVIHGLGPLAGFSVIGALGG